MSTTLVPAVLNGDNGEIRVSAAREYSQASGVQRVTDAMETMKAVRTFVQRELVDGHDFGTIPGAGERKVLLQPGAQKVLAFYRAQADPVVERIELANGHVEFIVTTHVREWGSDRRIGTGIGSCSSMESKYRFRNAKLVCPKCGKETLNRSKEQGKGYYCWTKVGGCGATFGEGDKSIAGQRLGKVENENPHDVRNTVLKMACKRSLVAAALQVGCVSDLFTQDLEDTFDLQAVPTPAPAPLQSSPGSEFVARLASESKRLGRDLAKSAAVYGAKKGYPEDLRQWTEAQASACWAWIEKQLAKTTEAPAPEPTAKPEPANPSGSVRSQFEAWLAESMKAANDWWSKSAERLDAQLPDRPLVTGMYQLSGHLGKWAETVPALGYVRPAPYIPGQVVDRLAALWTPNFDAIARELADYMYNALPAEALKSASPKVEREPGEDG